jgi:hypothetical protein
VSVNHGTEFVVYFIVVAGNKMLWPFVLVSGLSGHHSQGVRPSPGQAFLQATGTPET